MAANTAVEVLAKAETRIAQLTAENARLEKERMELRARVRPRRGERIIRQAHQDAGLILRLRYNDIPASRRALGEMGLMTQDRFGWAYGMLKMSRLEQARPADIQHLDACLNRLQSSVNRLTAMRSGDALNDLRAWAGQAKLRNIYREYG